MHHGPGGGSGRRGLVLVQNLPEPLHHRVHHAISFPAVTTRAAVGFRHYSSLVSVVPSFSLGILFPHLTPPDHSGLYLERHPSSGRHVMRPLVRLFLTISLILRLTKTRNATPRNVEPTQTTNRLPYRKIERMGHVSMSISAVLTTVIASIALLVSAHTAQLQQEQTRIQQDEVTMRHVSRISLWSEPASAGSRTFIQNANPYATLVVFSESPTIGISKRNDHGMPIGAPIREYSDGYQPEEWASDEQPQGNSIEHNIPPCTTISFDTLAPPRASDLFLATQEPGGYWWSDFGVSPFKLDLGHKVDDTWEFWADSLSWEEGETGMFKVRIDAGRSDLNVELEASKSCAP